MKLQARQVQQAFEDDLVAVLRESAGWPIPHWEFGRGVRYLDESIFGQLITPPQSIRFRRSDAVGFLWAWAVIDSHPGEPEQGCLIVSRPQWARHDIWQYAVATKPRGGVFGTIGPLHNTLATVIDSAGLEHSYLSRGQRLPF
jgi:hypothetical protein